MKEPDPNSILECFDCGYLHREEDRLRKRVDKPYITPTWVTGCPKCECVSFYEAEENCEGGGL